MNDAFRGNFNISNGEHVITTVRISGLTLSSLVLFAGAANAQTSPGNFYAEAAVGISHTNGDYAGQVHNSFAPSSTYRFDSASYDRLGSAGGRVAIGWRLAPTLAAELGYVHFGRHDSQASAVHIQTLTGTEVIAGRFRVSAVTLDAVGQLPLSGQFSASARIGVAMTEQQYSQTRTYANPTGTVQSRFPSNRQSRLHWGIGAQYTINPNLAAVANYERIENVGHDFSSVPIDKGVRAGTFGYGLLSVGLRYTF